jgi:hypothetical protein
MKTQKNNKLKKEEWWSCVQTYINKCKIGKRGQKIELTGKST